MNVNVAEPKRGTFEREGETSYSCDPKCREKFAADPAKHLVPSAERVEEPMPAGRMHLCPMDPEVREDRLGICPICGMALEPEMPSAEEEENPELTDFTKRFFYTLPLTIAVFVQIVALVALAQQSRASCNDWRIAYRSGSCCPSLEQGSVHPYASASLTANTLPLLSATDFNSITG